jgi:hypothetical protein
MRFFKPTLPTVAAPLLLVAFAIIPVLLLRFTVYQLLAVPIWPLIERLGWVYQDLPMFLTYPAAVLTAALWALPVFLIACTVRYCVKRR